MFDQTQNNGMMGMGQPMMGGYNYQGMAPGQPVQKQMNTLTQEQINKLRQNTNQFSLNFTEEEYLRGICNHRNEAGTEDTLVFDPLTGQARCTICGYTFRPVEPNISSEDIKEDVNRIVDILQTIKLMYIDLPAEAAREYFQIIPLIEKIPQLFEFAAKNMTKHETYNWQYNNRNMGAVSMLNNLQNMFAGNMMGQQQMMNGMGQPNPTTMGNMTPGYPGAAYGQSNGFGYPGASMAQPQMMNPAFNNGYNPQTAGFSYSAPATTTPATPSTEAPAALATDAAKDVSVTQPVTI